MTWLDFFQQNLTLSSLSSNWCLLTTKPLWSIQVDILIRLCNLPLRTIRCSKCQGHHCTGNNQVPSIKTSSSVVEVVKLMPWRQAKSPLKIPSWSGGKMSSSYIFYNWHPPDQEGNFKGEVACLQGINLTTSNTEDDVFMDGTWLLPVQWCPWHWFVLLQQLVLLPLTAFVEKRWKVL